MRRLLLGLTIGTALAAVVPLPAGAEEELDREAAVAPLAESADVPVGQPAPAAQADRYGFLRRLFNAYIDEFREQPPSNAPEPARRAMPSPWSSPPFPGSEYQGYPLVGVPSGSGPWPLMRALAGTPIGDFLTEHRLNFYGWITGAANLSTANDSNSPTAYWLVPNTAVLDQGVVRLERNVDSVQQDHIDWGFRSSFLGGIDYRYMTAGGWTSDQLLVHNNLYGYDLTEQYADIYFPYPAAGMILRVGRWIACPDIETQFAPDNYIGSHSLLFTFDTYTQTGFMLTLQLNKQWMVQAGVHAGTDMAPWYQGAVPTGFLGVRWVAEDNNDSIYLVLNSINTAKFQRFEVNGQPAGHDNYNYLVGTWSHRFTQSGNIHTQTEGYFMWQRDAAVGGTPSIGPVRSFGGGGGLGPEIKGLTATYGILNYTVYGITNRDYLVARNEWWKDQEGQRSGFATNYTSHTIGWSHQITDSLMIRPEIGYYHSYDTKAFDLGRKDYLWLGGVDMTVRF